MQRSVFGPAARLAGFAFLAAVLLTGCSSKVDPVGPGDSSGASSDVVLFGFQDQAVTSFTLSDPGTPSDPFDDRLLSTATTTFGGDTTSAILQILDSSPANSMRPYRREGAGAFTRFLDFDVQANDRNLRTGVDTYLLRDPSGVTGVSQYLATGLVNGLETTTSPTSNKVVPWGPVTQSLVLSISRLQRDSVMSISFTPDPRAVIYVLEGYLFNNVQTSRDLGALSSFPLPVAMPHQISQVRFVLPGQETQIRIPLYRVPFQKNQFPLTLVMRMSAIDAGGRVVARSAPDFVLRPLGRDDANNNIYELDPLGGWIITCDPYPRGYGRPQDAAEAMGPGVPYETVQTMVGGRAPAGALSTVTYESLLPSLRQITLAREASGERALSLPGLLSTVPHGMFRPQQH